MSAVPTVTFNGTNINTFGLYLQAGTEGWLSGAMVRQDIPALEGSSGGVIPSVDTVEPRRLVLDVMHTAASLATLRGYTDTLWGYFRTTVTVRMADGANTREIAGRLNAIDLRPYRIPNSPRLDGRLTFVCGDPYWKATSATNETITGTPNSIALGTAPVQDWVLTITATGGDITDITVTFGAFTLTWIGTVSSGDALVIDASDYTVENDGTDALATYTGGFPALDPRASPSVSATKDSGAGTIDGDLDFTARYY